VSTRAGIDANGFICGPHDKALSKINETLDC
jgi:hypothetical protein